MTDPRVRHRFGHVMGTVLNLGMNDAVAEGFAAETGNASFAYVAYRRFVPMYGDVVLGLKGSRSPFEGLLHARNETRKVSATSTACGATTR